MISLGLDIGSNSLGSAWYNSETGEIKVGLSVFPAGVDESEEKRGEPKNAKRRSTRRTRITLARRAGRKRALRLRLTKSGLLPPTANQFKKLLEGTDPWELRRRGLDQQLSPHEFGRVLLHLAQRRGAMGLKIAAEEDGEERDDGKVKAAISAVRRKMRERNARTFGELMAITQAERITPITSEDKRPINARRGPREYRDPIRNKAANYEHCADRAMIRDEFAKLWNKQRELGGELAMLLTDELRREMDDESADSVWRHKGLLFAQRRAYWDVGTLGRCVLEPTERCVPHADMYASRYLVIETVNNLKVVEWGRPPRSLTAEERDKIKNYLSQPLGVHTKGRSKGEPKQTVTVTDLRDLMGWGRATKSSQFRFNIETDPDRVINTDWFSREIIYGAIGHEHWRKMAPSAQDGINRAILKCDPDQEKDGDRLKQLVMQDWAGLSERQADALVTAWRKRPRPDAKRLNLSRKAVQKFLPLMDEGFVNAHREPGEAIKWYSLSERAFDPTRHRWPTQIEARIVYANRLKQSLLKELERTGTTAEEAQEAARRYPEFRRYATGAKGASARDRHYMKKHLLKKGGQLIYGPDGLPLHEPPPAPMIGNPVVRKAIHEVRRHIVEFLRHFGSKPDEVRVELAREARMGKLQADELLFRNRLRNRIRNDIVREFNLAAMSSTQQRAAVERVVLAVQQNCVCPLCGETRVEGETEGITLRTAALGQGCELAHIVPQASGGHNGLANLVLAHEKCNRLMKRRTPRQYWDADLPGGFERGITWIEKIYGDIDRPKAAELKTASGTLLWLCYFEPRDDRAKVERFKKDVSDIQGMTPRQEAATKYATRQVMSYLADALFEGNGLPERGGDRRIFATDGLWTSRLRREWGLLFDPHEFRAKGLSNEQEHERKEKDRGDHRHHAIDAIVIALTTREVQLAWENRELQAEREGVNTASEDQMENYRRTHRLDPPAPYQSREEFREAVRRAVYGDGPLDRPVCHRPVKRKLIGALHEETLFGPVLEQGRRLTEFFTARKSVLQLDPNHLRMPIPESRKDALQRLIDTFKAQGLKPRLAKEHAERVVSSANYRPKLVDPPPGKSGIVRDIALRQRIRECLSGFEYVRRDKLGEAITEPKLIDPDDFTQNEIKQAVENQAIRHVSGVPIRSVVLLRTMSDPVIVDRKRIDHSSGRMVLDDNPASKRAYVGGNNHHIEIRARVNKRGEDVWTGEIVTAYQAAERLLAKVRQLRKAGIRDWAAFRKLRTTERRQLRDTIRAIEKNQPLIDRSDNDEKGGRFIMSLCEGEMLFMRHKNRPDEVEYFVVAKLDKPPGDCHGTALGRAGSGGT